MLKEKEQTSVNVTKDDQMVIPIAVALAQHSGTKTQLAIINAILQRLQSLILQSYNHYQQGGTQLSLNFDDIDGVEVNPETNQEGNKGDLKFNFRLRDLGIAPKHYPEAFDLLMKLGELNIQLEIEDKQGTKGITRVQLFRPIIWLGKNVQKIYDEGWENTDDSGHFHYKYLQGPSVSIVIQPFVAQRLLRPDRIGHMLDIALDLKSKYSIKLYWFFALYWKKHEHFVFTWQALRLQLGIDKFVDNTTRNRIIRRYEGNTLFIYTQNDEDIIKGTTDKGKESYRWSEFKKNIMDTVERDFKRMNDDERMEYSVKYDVIMHNVFKNNTTIEEPERIVFDITLSPIGKKIKSGSSNPVAEQMAIEKDMEERLAILHRDAWDFTHSVSPADLPLLAEKVQELIKEVGECGPEDDLSKTFAKIDAETTLSEERKKKRKQMAIRKYALKALDDFVKKELKFTEAEEVKEEPKQKSDSKKEPTAEEARKMFEETASKKKPALEPDQWTFTGWDNNLLRIAVEKAKAEVSEAEYKLWIEPAFLQAAHIVDGKKLMVRYEGAKYKGKAARGHKGFIALLKHLREQFEGRIDDIEAVWIIGQKKYEL